MDHFFGPAEIEKASGGEVTQIDLRNYVRDRRFNTTMREPRAGKPRAFPLPAVYEAVLLKYFASCSVSLEKAKLWNKEILEWIAQHGVAIVNVDTGSQSGPRGWSPKQVVLFHPSCDKPLLLSDSQGGMTLNQAFYQLRRHVEKKPGPGDLLCALHLPAVISKINHALGLTPDEAGTAGPP